MYILESFDKELYERDWRENIRAEVKAEVREEVKAEVKEEVKAEVKEEVKAEVKEEVKAEVEAELKAESEVRFLQLISCMTEDGMLESIPKLSKDPEFLKEMYQKYHL